MDTHTKTAQAIIAQQLPDKYKLQQLLLAAEFVRDIVERKPATPPAAGPIALDEYNQELRVQLNELLSTAYATELHLLILPLLMKIKQGDEL
jgi:hypothetical protein